MKFVLISEDDKEEEYIEYILIYHYAFHHYEE